MLRIQVSVQLLFNELQKSCRKRSQVHKSLASHVPMQLISMLIFHTHLIRLKLQTKKLHFLKIFSHLTQHNNIK